MLEIVYTSQYIFVNICECCFFTTFLYLCVNEENIHKKSNYAKEIVNYNVFDEYCIKTNRRPSLIGRDNKLALMTANEVQEKFLFKINCNLIILSMKKDTI